MLTIRFADQLRSLQAAAPAWAALAVPERLQPVRRLRQLLVERADDLARILSAEIGKSAEEAVGGDLLPLAAHCRFLERRAARVLARRRYGVWDRPAFLWGYRPTVHRRPWGLVGIIGTWNYPLYLNGVQITSALVAGNVVLWKPSELAAQSAEALVSLVRDAGFPAGILQLAGHEREDGAAMLEAPLDYLVFTGSAAVGRTIAERLGQRLIPSTLELSGCDALIALPDAALERVVQAAWFGMLYNRGQTCVAVRRLLVPAAWQDRIVQRLAERLQTAAPVRLRTSQQCVTAESLLAQARAAGARVLRPEAAAAPPDFLPAVVAGAAPTLDVVRADFFAPVLAVMPYKRVEDIPSLVSTSRFGLEAKIFTTDLDAARRLAARLPIGLIAVNDVLTALADPRTSLGGRGQSGWGVTQGEEGLLAMTVPQTVSIRHGNYRPHLLAPGQRGAFTAAALQHLLAALYGQGSWRRVKALLGLVRESF